MPLIKKKSQRKNMSKEEELHFDFPEVEIKDDASKEKGEYKNKDKYEEVVNEADARGMVEELKSAVKSGKESGEILSEKTNIDGTRISEVYKGMGMAAGVTIGVGKVTKTMSKKFTGKILDKLSEKKAAREEKKKNTE